MPPARDGDASNGGDAPRARRPRASGTSRCASSTRAHARAARRGARRRAERRFATRVVLDMRRNRGGAFQSAVSAAELLIAPNRPVVEVLGQRGEVSTFATPPSEPAAPRARRAPRRRRCPSLRPLQAWVGRGSGLTASAAEVLRGRAPRRRPRARRRRDAVVRQGARAGGLRPRRRQRRGSCSRSRALPDARAHRDPRHRRAARRRRQAAARAAARLAAARASSRTCAPRRAPPPTRASSELAPAGTAARRMCVPPPALSTRRLSPTAGCRDGAAAASCSCALEVPG